MNRNFTALFHMNNEKNYMKVCEICNKYELQLLTCMKYDALVFITNSIKPMYIIIDDDKMREDLINDFVGINNFSYIYIVGEKEYNITKDNVIHLNNYNELAELFENQFKNNNYFSVDEIVLRQLLSKELDKLYFRTKLIGVKYLTELIINMIYLTPLSKLNCELFYDKLAEIYNTTNSSIERSIRFCISNAFMYCPKKELFYEISKTNKKPSIKEIAVYILDKITIELNLTKNKLKDNSTKIANAL